MFHNIGSRTGCKVEQLSNSEKEVKPCLLLWESEHVFLGQYATKKTQPDSQMLMKIDQNMESGGSSGEDVTSAPSRGSLSPMGLPGRGSKTPYSPPLERGSPLGPPKSSIAAQHMINSLAVSSAAKSLNPNILASLTALNAMNSAAAAAQFHHDFGAGNSSYVDRGMDRHPYGSPPAPMAPTNDPSANECKLVEYRGQKVAAFVINGDTMLCLPQAFELFLKHLVGGLHTVYTKLKRLDIIPVVCNVEQVRILRGLGAIQPGVNRCKLLSCKDFDTLYKDCTTASSRPGRPPKRTSVPLVPLSSAGGAAAQAQFMSSLKKNRLENGDYPPYDTGHHNPADVMRLEKSPLLANGYNHPPTQIPPMHLLPGLAGQQAAAAAAVAAHAALFSPSGLPLPPGHPRDCRNTPLQGLDAVAARNATWETCRTAYEDFVKQFESRYHEDCNSDSRSEKSSHVNEGGSGEALIRNGNMDGASPVLNLSKNTTDAVSDSDEAAADDQEDYDSENEHNSGTGKYPVGMFDVSMSERSRKASSQISNERKSPSEGSVPRTISEGHHQHSSIPPHQAHQFEEVTAAEAAISSTETLLRNIQGLLQVAADNAKQQERRINLERAELKMDLMREREMREQLEKQLVEERNLRSYYEKRWKKERRFRKKLEDQGDDGSPQPVMNAQDTAESQHHQQHGAHQQDSPQHTQQSNFPQQQHQSAQGQHAGQSQIHHSVSALTRGEPQPQSQQLASGGDKSSVENGKAQRGEPCTNGSSVKGDSSER